MKPSVQKIITKLAKEQKKEANVKLEKVELAKKPENILNKLKALDGRIDKGKQQMEKAFIAYRNKRREFIDKMQTIREQAVDLTDDLLDVENAAKDLGVDPKMINGYREALDMGATVKTDSKAIQNLYPDV
jgi:uncharacterized protein (UPF0335 family)